MIKLKSFKIDDWKYLKKWISSESELIQFAGQIFSFPIDQKQVKLYLSDSNRTVFKIKNKNHETIGIAELSIQDIKVAKLARILIGNKAMRGRGIGTELINELANYAFKNLKMERLVLNVYSWNIAAIRCYEKAGFYRTDKPMKIMKAGQEEWEVIEMEKKPVSDNSLLQAEY